MCQKCEGKPLDQNCEGSNTCNDESISASGLQSGSGIWHMKTSTFEDYELQESFYSGSADIPLESSFKNNQLKTPTSDIFTSGSLKIDQDVSNFDPEPNFYESSTSGCGDTQQESTIFNANKKLPEMATFSPIPDVKIDQNWSILENSSIYADTLMCQKCDFGYALSDDFLSCIGE